MEYLGIHRKYCPTKDRIQLTRRPAHGILKLPFPGGVVVCNVQVIKLYLSTERSWSEVVRLGIFRRNAWHYYLFIGLSGILDILYSGSK